MEVEEWCMLSRAEAMEGGQGGHYQKKLHGLDVGKNIQQRVFASGHPPDY